MPYCFGVTPAEISFDDDSQWPAVFDTLCGHLPGLTRGAFYSLLRRVGTKATDQQIRRFWVESCGDLFAVDQSAAEAMTLDGNDAYRLIRYAGLCARQIRELLRDSDEVSYFKLYWNQIRMGGRQPSEISRTVTLDDAFAAIGVIADDEGSYSANVFEEVHDLSLPGVLKRFGSQGEAASAVFHSHPNNPEVVPVGAWDLRRGLDRQGLDGDYAVTIMRPHQGNHEWLAVFRQHDDDARVYVNWGEQGDEDEVWKLTAPTIGMFFWDLAQTGLAWYQDTKPECGMSVWENDIGLFQLARG